MAPLPARVLLPTLYNYKHADCQTIKIRESTLAKVAHMRFVTFVITLHIRRNFQSAVSVAIRSRNSPWAGHQSMTSHKNHHGTHCLGAF